MGDAAATVIDPFSALLANGLGWVMEHFEPLREILDKLTGIPDKITAHAQTWANMAGALQAMAEDLRSDLAADLPDWGGTASEAYRSIMTNNVDGFGGLAVLADTMSAATQAAGNLVQFTRDIVRDLICDLVARVIVWAAEALAIVTIPVVTAQIVAAVAKWCAKIFGYTGALITSLQNLTTLMEG
ncbi:WXG100 family type VII secretion target [Actinoplanes sp. NPDC049316]|uniref:WXG100 family type VII secretion target n=1 Tax=Actinoplanes sp. NPDC049316 TaxID=3154727 RepID=UPI0034161ADE